MSQAADKVASTVGRTSAMVNGAGHRHHRNLGGIHQATAAARLLERETPSPYSLIPAAPTAGDSPPLTWPGMIPSPSKWPH